MSKENIICPLKILICMFLLTGCIPEPTEKEKEMNKKYAHLSYTEKRKMIVFEEKCKLAKEHGITSFGSDEDVNVKLDDSQLFIYSMLNKR